MSPRSCSVDIRFISSSSPDRLPRTCSIVSLMKTFLPGNRSIDAEKSPSPNALKTPMAFFFTSMCEATIVLMPSAIVRKPPANRCESMYTSMSPRSCSVDIRFISVMSPATADLVSSNDRRAVPHSSPLAVRTANDVSPVDNRDAPSASSRRGFTRGWARMNQTTSATRTTPAPSSSNAWESSFPWAVANVMTTMTTATATIVNAAR